MIGVILVGYNSRKYLPDCLSSLKNSDTDDYKIIFVDNNSTDDSVEYVRQHYPDTIIIQNDANEGFAQANNQGVDCALELGASAVFFLNVDTIIAPDCFKHIKLKLNQQTIIQPLILLHKEKKTERVNTSGGVMHYLGFSYCSDYNQPMARVAEKQIPIASGAAMVVPKEILEKSGAFDPDFFMYHEDVDLSWRARLAGYTVQLVPQAKVWHKYTYNRNSGKFYYYERNRWFFILKNYSGMSLVLLAPMFFLNELAMWGYSLVTHQAKDKWRTYASLFQDRKKIKKSRHNVQSMRRVTDAKLFSSVTSTLKFEEMTLPALGAYSVLLKGYWFIIYPILRRLSDLESSFAINKDI